MPDSMGLDDSVPIKTLLITVFESVVEVFLLCLAGYILSKAGVTDKATQRKLNVINVSLFTPALLFSKVAYSLTPAKLKEMWIIPLGFVVVTGLSAGVAWVLAKLFKLKKSQTAYAMCAAMFQNSNSLPIALIQSLVIEVPGLKWGKDDTKDQMLGRALTYLVLYSTLGMMLRWSWGVKLLSQADDEAIEVEAEPNHRPIVHDHTVQSPEALAPHPGARETDPFFTSADNIAHDEQDERRNPSGQFIISSPSAIDEEPDSPTVPFTAPGSAHSMHPPLVKRGSTAGHSIMSRRSSTLSQHRKKLTRTESGREFWGLPEQPKVHHIALIKEDSSESEHEDEEWGTLTPSLRRRPLEPPRSPFQSFLFKVKNRTKTSLKAINDFMTVPMYAALLSIFIAMIPPLQAQMTRLKPLEQAIKGAGQCSIPVTLVVLGAFFYTPPDVKPGSGTIQLSNSHEEYNKKPNGLLGYLKSLFGGSNGSSSINDKSRAYPGENKTVFVAVISRMIIVPLLMLPVLALIAKYDPFEAAEDPVFILSAILLVSSPPALTLAQITQAASGDAFERLISKTISWSYAVLTPPLTLVYVVIGLIFGRLQ